MGKALQFNHRMRINLLQAKARFERLDSYLGKLADKGFDVAGVPFRLLDDLLSTRAEVDFTALIPLARHTLGGQPALLTAVLQDLQAGEIDHLKRLVEEGSAHTMTRFEAMGWATYLTHRADFPETGPAAGDVFQFWDAATPPPEVQDGKAQWQRTTQRYVWYDDRTVHDYIADGFGQDAARAYDALWHPALKSDVFRLYRLAQDGGVYSDADSHPQHRVSDFLKHAGGRVWAASMTHVPNCVAINGFLAGPPRHPLIEALLDQVLRNTRDVKSRGIFWLSGPGAFTSFLYQHQGEYDVGLLPQGVLKADLFRQFDASYKHTQQNWRVFEHQQGQDNAACLQDVLNPVEVQP